MNAHSSATHHRCWAAFLVDAMLVWGVASSAAYWLVLLLRFPGWVWYPVVAALLGSAGYFFRKHLSLPVLPRGKAAAALLLICAVSVSIALFTNRPDDDDISSSHRAFVAAADLSKPFALTDTAHDVPNLAPITPLHVFTSVEVTTALVARAFHIPQLIALHVLLPAIVNFMLPLVFFLLLRFFRLPVLQAVIGTGAALIFLVMCGDAHDDFGRFIITRSWQGKCILMGLIVPLALLFALRFQLYGRRGDLLRLHAVTLCGIGLSGSGLFLVPFVIGCASLAAAPFSRKPIPRLAMAASIVIFPAFTAALPFLGLLPRIGDISFYSDPVWPHGVIENLGLVFLPRAVALYLALLAAAYFFLHRPKEFRALLIYFALVAFLILTPGPRDILMKLTTPAAFWRFSYAFVIPLLAGLAAAGLARQIALPGRARILGIACAVALTAATFTLKRGAINFKTFYWPGPKFERIYLEAARATASTTPWGSVVLAPVGVTGALGLLRPDLKFIATRQPDTMHVFLDANRKEEGLIRTAWLEALESCDFSNAPRLDGHKTWPKLSIIAYSIKCPAEKIRSRLALGNNWGEIRTGDYGVLYHEGKF